MSLIPDGVPVAASNQLGGHLSERRYIYTFPYVRRARWIVVDSNDSTLRRRRRATSASIRKYEANKAWRIVYSSHGVTVLHRRPTAPR